MGNTKLERLRYRRRVLTVFLGFAALSACTKEQATNIKNPTQIIQNGNTIPSNTVDHSQVIFNSAYAFCASQKDCPESIGMIAFLQRTTPGMCTGFLIAPNLVLTQSQCAQGQLRFLLPETLKQKAETFEIKKAPIQIGNAALIELETPSTRAPLILSRKGTPDQTALKMYSFAAQSNTSLMGALKSTTCQSVMGSQIAPQYVEPLADEMAVSNCKVEPGLGGAPLLDTDGEVRALFVTTATYSLSIVRNTACLKLDGMSPIHPDCGKPHIDIQSPADHSRDLALAEIEKRFAVWEKDAESRTPVRFKLGQIGNGGFAPIPKCFFTRNIDSDAYQLPSPIWTIIQKVDQYQRPYFEAVNSLENFGTTVSFSMETLRANGKTPLYYRTGTIRDAIENFSFCAP